MLDGMYIELHRTFHRLQERSESEDYSLFANGQSLNWVDLNELYRVVILSEAGSGKTEEIRNTTQQIRAKGKPAFFIRLEHMATDFECAFEEGSFAEFQAWKATDAEGWLFLDSVDESRLKNPSDFNLAISRLGVQLGTAKQRLHIVITSRTSAWRSATDLDLCSKHLAVNPKQGKFEIVTLGELTAKQVEIFITAKGVKNTQLFLNAIERTDAWSFTSRPQDLAELTEFWNIHDRILIRHELFMKRRKRLWGRRSIFSPAPVFAQASSCAQWQQP